MGEVIRAFPPKQEKAIHFNRPPSDIALLKAVDNVPETRGMGVVLVSGSTVRYLRRAQPGHSFVVDTVRAVTE